MPVNLKRWICQSRMTSKKILSTIYLMSKIAQLPRSREVRSGIFLKLQRHSLQQGNIPSPSFSSHHNTTASKLVSCRKAMFLFRTKYVSNPSDSTLPTGKFTTPRAKRTRKALHGEQSANQHRRVSWEPLRCQSMLTVRWYTGAWTEKSLPRVFSPIT